ncbi:MAG: hypothetical protein KGV50_01205 [Gammaproteobacteria bacterium]|nr:hypothetical protein [Gammaproteobacteria bacterium]
MKNFKSNCLLAMLLSTSIISGCDNVIDSFESSSRSGTVANDDVEAPLSDKAKKYENALVISNKFMELWINKDFKTIHSSLIDPEVQEQLSEVKLADIYSNVEKTYGKLESYKVGQWAFEPKKAKKQHFLFSIKVVTHKNKKLNYLFEFVLDGEYKKLAGFYVREKPTFRAPGQIHSSKQ